MLALAADTMSPTFQVRLDAPLTSYGSPAGTEFTATVISPLEIDGQSIIPQGSVVRGTVRRASAVGFGLRHERATLELAFQEYELADGTVTHSELAWSSLRMPGNKWTRGGGSRACWRPAIRRVCFEESGIGQPMISFLTRR